MTLPRRLAFLPPLLLRLGAHQSRSHLQLPRRHLQATAATHAMAIDRTTLTPSTPLDRDDVRAALRESSAPQDGLLGQVDEVTRLSFQQAINCCGLTSVAYALSALGCPTTVDELFLSVGVGVESAVGDGMTLAEIYDASLRYIARANLPLFAECYHFDSFSTSVDDFRAACKSEAIAGIDDLFILNFHSGIAHGWETGGGGHFSLLTAWRESSDDIVMSDVHAIKYGAYWATPTAQMFAAMADKDSCGRARGAIRYGRLDKQPPLERPVPGGLVPSLVDWTSPPARTGGTSRSVLMRYIPSLWDTVLGVKNMEGVSALSAALRLVEDDHASISRLDAVMRALQESYLFHLNNFATADKLVEMGVGLGKKGLTRATTRLVTLTEYSGAALRAALEEVGCGQEGVAVMAAYDLNAAIGAELLPPETGEAGALTHGTNTWSLLAGFAADAALDDDSGLVVAPAHNVILTGRLWSTSMKRMAEGMKIIDGQCCLVVLDRRV